MYNRIILMGRLTKDPELKTTQSGISMCRFSIAVDRAYKQGEEKQTDFFDITAWRQTAEFVSKYFCKGKVIHIEGKIQNNNYTDQNGIKHYSTAIIADNVAFCGRQAAASEMPPNAANAAKVGTASPSQQGYQNQSYQQQGGYQQPYAQQGYQQQPYQPPQGQPQGYPQNNQHLTSGGSQPQQNNIQLGDLDDFETILADGDVPF